MTKAKLGDPASAAVTHLRTARLQARKGEPEGARSGLMGWTGAFALALALFAATPVRAQSCQDDFLKLSERRGAEIAALNKLGQASQGKMDPAAACPLGKKLAATEGEMLAYMEKNKDWCNIPDETVSAFKQARAKTQKFAQQACVAAAQAKKMQQDQAAGGSLTQSHKLPGGPL